MSALRGEESILATILRKQKEALVALLKLAALSFHLQAN